MRINRTAAAFALGLAAGCLLATALAGRAQTQPGARSPLPMDQLRVFAEVYGAIKANYVEPIDDTKAIANCINGMVTGLDERSQFLDATAFRELRSQVSAPPTGGIGLELGMEGGFAKVVAPIEGTPASLSGLRGGDLLIRIDDREVSGQTLSDVVKLLRGKPGTEARLTVLRSGERAFLELAVRREIIRVNTVRVSRLESGLAYLRVSAFQEATLGRIAEELARFYRDGPGPQGLILDLRNNPGGLLSSAVGTSAAFLPEGALIGSTDGRVEDAKRRFVADDKDFLRKGDREFRSALPPQVGSVPLVVIVNRGSAAGSEFVAGALQDHKRAVIVGETTYGRGSVQIILPLPQDVALRLTTAYWYRPGGRVVEHKGIVPDVAVEGASAAPLEVPDPAKDAVLARAVAALRR